MGKKPLLPEPVLFERKRKKLAWNTPVDLSVNPVHIFFLQYGPKLVEVLRRVDSITTTVQSALPDIQMPFFCREALRPAKNRTTVELC
jgi:hypothetical protein